MLMTKFSDYMMVFVFVKYSGYNLYFKFPVPSLNTKVDLNCRNNSFSLPFFNICKRKGVEFSYIQKRVGKLAKKCVQSFIYRVIPIMLFFCAKENIFLQIVDAQKYWR